MQTQPEIATPNHTSLTCVQTVPEDPNPARSGGLRQRSSQTPNPAIALNSTPSCTRAAVDERRGRPNYSNPAPHTTPTPPRTTQRPRQRESRHPGVVLGANQGSEPGAVQSGRIPIEGVRVVCHGVWYGFARELWRWLGGRPIDAVWASCCLWRLARGCRVEAAYACVGASRGFGRGVCGGVCR